MKEALITRYRPKSFEEFRGNKGTVMGLSMQVRKEGRPHSYLFIGPSGSGKTTLARIVAKELGCEDSEFYEFNAANTRGIDTIRAIIEQARYEPLWGTVKVFLLDECFKGNTRVTLADDSKVQIKDLVREFRKGKSFRVKCYNVKTKLVECKPVISVFSKWSAGPKIKLHVQGDSEFSCTENHKILTSFGYVEAKNLSVGDKVLQISITETVWEAEVLKVEYSKAKYPDMVYDIEVADNHNFIVGRGNTIVSNCHQITGAAAEALLKFLEDPPRHVYTILCTTEPQKMLQTVKTRCTMWPVSSLSQPQTVELLNWVLKQEKITQDSEVIESVAVVSEGCPRKALNILDKILGVPDKLAQLKIILDSSVDETSLELLGDMLLDKEKKWEQVVPLIEKLMKSEDEVDESNHLHVKEKDDKRIDPKSGKKPAQPKMTQEEAESFRFKMLGFFMWKLLKFRDPATRERIAKIMDIFSVPWYNTGKSGLILACFKAKQV